MWYGKVLCIVLCDMFLCLVFYMILLGNFYVGVFGFDEIWFSGLWNLYCFSFDCEIGDMIFVDVGQNMFEEVFIQLVGVVGQNYGWFCCEGDIFGVCMCLGNFMEFVIVYLYIQGNCLIIGGYWYCGCIQGL